jgi:RNA polymerase sigma-70 factor (ECF subfamily)
MESQRADWFPGTFRAVRESNVKMSAEPAIERTPDPGLSDEDVVARVRQGEVALFEIIMRRYNQRLYRVARTIVGDDEAEDVLQDAYVRAYAHLDQFAGRAKFSTWLTRIAIHAALARARKAGRVVEIEDDMLQLESTARGPETQVADRELADVLEAAVESLPPSFRAVFMLREVEGLSTAEAADCLDIPEETVKTRLHRARGLLRRSLYARLGDAAPATFQFGFARCDRIVARVLAKIAPNRV